MAVSDYKYAEECTFVQACSAATCVLGVSMCSYSVMGRTGYLKKTRERKQTRYNEMVFTVIVTAHFSDAMFKPERGAIRDS